MKELEILYKLQYDVENLKKAIGRIERRLCEINKSAEPMDNEFKVYSQWGEDGIIQWLINNLNISNEIFVEFGCSNYDESNTRFLLENNNWSGLIMDGSLDNIKYIKKQDYYWRYNIKADAQFITRENINSLIKENGIEGDIGILSIDIDGNDYWVWKEIDVVNPDIVILEYNSLFGNKAKVTTPYKEDFVRQNYHYTYLVYGASIAALVELGEQKGYSLVAGNSAGNNIFFVRNDLCNDVIKKIDVAEAYKKSKFREMRDIDGRLTYASFEERQKCVEDVEVCNIENSRLEKLKDALVL